jgi:hypothetical protein
MKTLNDSRNIAAISNYRPFKPSVGVDPDPLLRKGNKISYAALVLAVANRSTRTSGLRRAASDVVSESATVQEISAVLTSTNNLVHKVQLVNLAASGIVLLTLEHGVGADVVIRVSLATGVEWDGSYCYHTLTTLAHGVVRNVRGQRLWVFYNPPPSDVPIVVE